MLPQCKNVRWSGCGLVESESQSTGCMNVVYSSQNHGGLVDVHLSCELVTLSLDHAQYAVSYDMCNKLCQTVKSIINDVKILFSLLHNKCRHVSTWLPPQPSLFPYPVYFQGLA